MVSDTVPARLLVVGAGSRGFAYCDSLYYTNRVLPFGESPKGIIVGVAEPHEGKRRRFVQSFISSPNPSLIFSDWINFVSYLEAKFNNAKGEFGEDPGVDAVAVCTMDHMHEPVVVALRKFSLHILCEKPLSNSLNSTFSLTRSISDPSLPQVLFLVCHVLRYSPHNMILRKLVVEDKAIGEVINIDWTEPVGYWHFAHSYVRGNWNNESESAPSLLTKCCHDLDMVLWLMSDGGEFTNEESQEVFADSIRKPNIRLPSKIYSRGTLAHFRSQNKPDLAKAANSTNCLSCPAERQCIYSAKRIYLDHHFKHGSLGWPVKIVLPDIEDIASSSGWNAAENALIAALKEDYDTPENGKKYYGRCVYEANNDVCDNQVVILTWESDPSSTNSPPSKMATIRMVASTSSLCDRRGTIAGTLGEIAFDTALPGQPITVTDFRKFPGQEGYKKVYYPADLFRGQDTVGGHGGGDKGMVNRFMHAVWKVKNRLSTAGEAQESLGMSWEECEASHMCVWAGEESKKGRKEVDFVKWYKEKLVEFKALKN